MYIFKPTSTALIYSKYLWYITGMQMLTES